MMTPKSSLLSGKHTVSKLASSSPVIPRRGLGDRSTSYTSTSSRRGGGPVDVDDVDETWNSDDDELCSPGWEQLGSKFEMIQSIQEQQQDYQLQSITLNSKSISNNTPSSKKKYMGGPVDLDEELSFDETFVVEEMVEEEEDHLVGWKSNSIILASASPQSVIPETDTSVIQSFEAVHSHDIGAPPMIYPITTPYHSTTKSIPKLLKSKRDTPNINNVNITPRNRLGIPVANNGVVSPVPQQRNLQSTPATRDVLKTVNTLGSDEGSLLLVMPPVVERIQSSADVRRAVAPSNRSNASGASSIYDGVDDDNKFDDKNCNQNCDDDDDDDNSQKWELQSGSAEWRSIVHKIATSPETAIIPTKSRSTAKSTKVTTNNTEVDKWQGIAPVLLSFATSDDKERNGPIDVDDIEIDDIPKKSNHGYSVGRLGIEKMPTPPMVVTPAMVVTPQSRTISYPTKARRDTSDTDDEYDEYYDDDDRIDDKDINNNQYKNTASSSTSFLRRLTACVAPMNQQDVVEQQQRQRQHQQTTGSSLFGSILCGRSTQNVFFEEESEVTSKNQSSVQVVTSPYEIEYKRMKASFVGTTISKPRSTPPPQSSLSSRHNAACGAFSSIPITPSRSSSRVSSFPSSILSSDVGSGYRGGSTFSTPSALVVASPYSQTPTSRLRQNSDVKLLQPNGSSGSTVTTKSSQECSPIETTRIRSATSSERHYQQQHQQQQENMQFDTSTDRANEMHFV